MGYRYIGSKSKILGVVLSKVAELVPPSSHVVDLMTGTATVAVELRKLGYRVTANDLMTYSYHHAVTGLKFSKLPSFSGARDFIKLHYRATELELYKPTNYDKMIAALSESAPIKGYFWNEFSLSGKPANSSKARNYYSSENAAKIDGIRLNISRLYQANALTKKEYSLLLHDLIMGTNDVANIAGTYGHHLSKLVGRAKEPLKLYPSNLVLQKDTRQHKVIQGYAEEVAPTLSCDLCYIDPPYMKRQYAANYHILETLARGDEPEAIGVSGLRPWRDQYSNFCTKTKIRDSFRKIVSSMACRHFLISYSEDGLLGIDELVDILKPFGDVKVDEFIHKRFRSNTSKLTNELTEYLIHLSKD